MMTGERAPAVHLFRVSRHAGIWCVIHNGVFFGDHGSEAEAIAAAHAAADKEQAVGHAVRVVTAADGPSPAAAPHRGQ